MSNLTNLTIQVPPGTTLSSDGRVLCISDHAWKEALLVFTFFATNYLAHAATIKSTPGDTTTVTVCNICLAIVFPMSGLTRALNAIARLARFGGSEVENACRAGALCMVVRSPEWMPTEGETLRSTVVDDRPDKAEEGTETEDEGSPDGCKAKLVLYLPRYAREDTSAWSYFDTVGRRAFVDLDLTRVHGSYNLPQGYCFAVVPRDTLLTTISTPFDTDVVPGDISSSYSTAKAALSIIQALAAAVTLTLHKGDLIDRWGYASYHLTVVPYLVMTIVNFVSNALTPDYSCLYMVRTKTMDEAIRHNGEFIGTVARVRDVEAVDASSEQEILRWQGLSTEHLQQAVKLLAGQQLPRYGNLFERQDRRRRSAVHMDITCSEPDIANADGDEIPIMEFTAGTSKYNVQCDAGPHIQSSQMPMTRMLQKAFMEALGSSLRQSIFVLHHRMQEVADCTRQQLSDQYPRPRKSSTWVMLPFIAINRIVMNLFLTFSRDPARSGLMTFFSIYAVKHQELEVIHATSAKTRLGQAKISCLAWLAALKDTTTQTIPVVEQELVKIYIPCCAPFRRAADPALRKHNPVTGALLAMVAGLVLLAVVVWVIAWQSRWFYPGRSSVTLRVIMLIWLCEGTIGLLLPALSLKELVLVFIFLPLYAIQEKSGHVAASSQVPPHWVFGLIPWGLFVAPIWGFILVGQMLVQQGSCVVLF